MEKAYYISISNRDFDEFSGGQKFLTVSSLGTCHPLGHSYFVFEIEPGNWFIEWVNGSYSDGFQDVMITLVPTNVTVALEAEAGVMYYLDKFVISGNLEPELAIELLSLNKEAAVNYLKTFPNLMMEKVDDEVEYFALKCAKEKSLFEEFCNHKEVKLIGGSFEPPSIPELG